METKPKELKKAIEPIGIENDKYIREYAEKSKCIIVAWGNDGSYMGRDKKVLKILSSKNLKCLKITKLKKPGHPLFINRKTEPIDFPRRK